MDEDYSKWPYQWIDARYSAALQFLHAQSAHAYVEHVGKCNQCSVFGLCSTGTELNKICRDLEDQIKEEGA